MRDQIILRIAAKILVGPILLFALYVQFHGDYGPGGGFQAGVIFAAGVILYALVFGLDRAKAAIPTSIVTWCGTLGVLIFAGVGVVAMFMGGNFLDYGVLLYDAEHAQHIGILLVEAGVLVTVFGVMVTLFYSFAGRRRSR
ncbi:MAG: Na(+)/H(+) antiporter subunit B [Gammaproteobacteria bacterium]|nr:Na(+)/H(+) antiporter subunit B [Gammaproteobacteria bacterium]MDE0651949.1 Na(+)/H(+) antiporter subunit B [Gammaproteobacteria bacterium]